MKKNENTNGLNESLAVMSEIADIKKLIFSVNNPISFESWPKCCKIHYDILAKRDENRIMDTIDRNVIKAYERYIQWSLAPDYIPCRCCAKSLIKKGRDRKSIHFILTQIDNNDKYFNAFISKMPSSIKKLPYGLLQRILFTAGLQDITWIVMKFMLNGKSLCDYKYYFIKREIDLLKKIFLDYNIKWGYFNPNDLINTKMSALETVERLKSSGGMFGRLGKKYGNNKKSKTCGGKIDQCKKSGATHRPKLSHSINATITEKLRILSIRGNLIDQIYMIVDLLGCFF